MIRQNSIDIYPQFTYSQLFNKNNKEITSVWENQSARRFVAMKNYGNLLLIFCYISGFHLVVVYNHHAIIFENDKLVELKIMDPITKYL